MLIYNRREAQIPLNNNLRLPLATFIAQRGRVWLGEPIPLQHLALFFDLFATLLATGMPVDEAFLKAAPPIDLEIQAICASVVRPLQTGVPLHQALYPYRHRLPEIVLPILEVGEVSGTLEDAAHRLAHAFGEVSVLERRYRTTVFYPWYVILGLSLREGAVSMVGETRLMVIRTLFTFLMLSSLYVAGRFAARFLFRWQGLRLVVDTIKLALPHAGTIARNFSAARWGRSFATLWSAGVPVSHALEISSRSALNAHYERAIQQVALQTRQGYSLAESLSATQLLPAYLPDILHTGEMSGRLGAAIEHFVRILEDEAFTRASQTSTVYISVGQTILLVTLFVFALR
jgi:type II secretory pathway component PulF